MVGIVRILLGCRADPEAEISLKEGLFWRTFINAPEMSPIGLHVIEQSLVLSRAHLLQNFCFNPRAVRDLACGRNW